MKQYLDLVERVLYYGRSAKDRTGVGTIRLFGEVLRFDLQSGFPAVTCKELKFKSVAAELAGFLKGHQYAFQMEEEGTKIWNANAEAFYQSGKSPSSDPAYLGPIYGAQWRNWQPNLNDEDPPIDQLRLVVDEIKSNPTSRRLLVTAWNPGELHLMCLPPCHTQFQFFVDTYCGELSCKFDMRSVDVFLGMPFDIASYALLTHIVANETGLRVGELIGTFGDTHIYKNHLEQVRLMLMREPLPLPQLSLDESATIDNFNASMATLQDYEHHPAIPAPMAV